MNLIYQHPASKGSIYQCGAMEIPGVMKTVKTHGYIHAPIVVEALSEKGITVLALTAHGFQPAIELGKSEQSNLEVLHMPFHDEQEQKPEDISEIELMINSAALVMAEAVMQGKQVLSTCWAGINRSSLLTAFTLKNLLSVNPHEIISLIRKNRNPHCLNNKLFEGFIINGFDMLTE